MKARAFRIERSTVRCGFARLDILNNRSKPLAVCSRVATLRQRIKHQNTFAMFRCRRSQAIPAEWKGHLSLLLLPPRSADRAEHFDMQLVRETHDIHLYAGRNQCHFGLLMYREFQVWCAARPHSTLFQRLFRESRTLEGSHGPHSRYRPRSDFARSDISP